jgi:enoyl-CoA hydratase/carnithine racemase
MFAEVGPPARAVEMGFLDELVDHPTAAACSLAATLARLPPLAFATTKRRVRRGLVAELTALDRG